MGLTARQRELRKNALGGSVMAAVMGLDVWRNAGDVWLEKTGKVEGKPANEAMEAGSLFEEAVLQWSEKKLGKIRRNVERTAPLELPIKDHIDAILIDKHGQPLEAKTAGLFGPLPTGWGEEGTDEVPDHVLVQAHVHMLCSRSNICHIAAFLGGRGFVLYEVPRDDELVEMIAEKANQFWFKHVLANEPPAETPHIQVIKSIVRVAGKEAGIEPSLACQWRALREQEAELKNAREQAEAALLNQMGDAEIGIAEGVGMMTYKEQKRKGYTVEASTYRVLRFKKDEGALLCQTKVMDLI